MLLYDYQISRLGASQMVVQVGGQFVGNCLESHFCGVANLNNALLVPA